MEELVDGRVVVELDAVDILQVDQGSERGFKVIAYARVEIAHANRVRGRERLNPVPCIPMFADQPTGLVSGSANPHWLSNVTFRFLLQQSIHNVCS